MNIKKTIKRIFITLGLLYAIICVGLYSFQEKLLFRGRPLPPNQTFAQLDGLQPEEQYFPVGDGQQLHGLMIKSGEQPSKGLLFYLHGNAGTVQQCQYKHHFYTQAGYDFFVLDYRGYGKSTGEIYNEAQFFKDVQAVFDSVKQGYDPDKIVITGYSVGTAAAAMLAATNPIQQLILEAPYYSIIDMMQRQFSFIPTFLLKYPFETHAFLEKVTVPVTIFHGDQDPVIPLASAQRLQQVLKPKDQFILLPSAGHWISRHPLYKETLGQLLGVF